MHGKLVIHLLEKKLRIAKAFGIAAIKEISLHAAEIGQLSCVIRLSFSKPFLPFASEPYVNWLQI